MDSDWKSSLGALLASGSLPSGDDTPAVKPETSSGDAGGIKPHLTIFKEKKGRGGKCALIIEGFNESDADLADLAAWLKRRLGVGGSCRGGEILIQGDNPARVAELLAEKGYRKVSYSK